MHTGHSTLISLVNMSTFSEETRESDTKMYSRLDVLNAKPHRVQVLPTPCRSKAGNACAYRHDSSREKPSYCCKNTRVLPSFSRCKSGTLSFYSLKPSIFTPNSSLFTFITAPIVEIPASGIRLQPYSATNRSMIKRYAAANSAGIRCMSQHRKQSPVHAINRLKEYGRSKCAKPLYFRPLSHRGQSTNSCAIFLPT